MEKVILMDGTEYTLAVNGFYSNDQEVALKLITEDSLETVARAFRAENAETMTIRGDTFQTEAQGYVRMGSVMTRDTDAVVETRMKDPERDDTGELVHPMPKLEEIRGTVVSLRMCKERMEYQVERNRADIDYLLMMEG